MKLSCYNIIVRLVICDSLLHTSSSFTATFCYPPVPSAPPTSVRSYSLNSTSLFLSWSLPPAKHRNGVIKGYNITIAEIGNHTDLDYVSEETHVLINNLKPDVRYTCRIAAFTSVGVGPFSDPTTISPLSGTGTYDPITITQHSQTGK